ncbi:hypothetical protein Ssi02_27040 [Sinosporangium siamense]|uniref:Uncharacterized protein n=1 Tax=Sinosporangium siamense TaxID=1367973 RepID=A0A919REM2_9ACTN|nr:hypothetical protein Ssi02_27040 [Sinosporangium siamense]
MNARGIAADYLPAAFSWPDGNVSGLVYMGWVDGPYAEKFGDRLRRMLSDASAKEAENDVRDR